MPNRPTVHRPPGHRRDTAHTDQQRGSAAARGYDRKWRFIRFAYLKQHPLCVDCLAKGRTEPATDVDHIIAKAKGGGDEWANLRALCHACHSRKTATVDRRRGQ